MTDLNCENICRAAQAVADGEPSSLTPVQIEAHLANCVRCRQEIEHLRVLSGLLEAHQRPSETRNIWIHIEPQVRDLTSRPRRDSTWRAFVMLGLVLLGYKLIEMIPDHDVGWPLKLVPVLLTVAVFGYLKENPFKINPELRGGLSDE